MELLAADAQDLAQDDLQRGHDRDGDDGAHDAGDLAQQQDGEGGDQRVDVHGPLEDERREQVPLDLAVGDEVDAGGDPVPEPLGEERDEGDPDPDHRRPGVGDHARHAGEDPERQEEGDPVDGQEAGGEGGVDRADERQAAQVAADRLVDLAQHVLVGGEVLGARLGQHGARRGGRRR